MVSSVFLGGLFRFDAVQVLYKVCKAVKRLQAKERTLVKEKLLKGAT